MASLIKYALHYHVSSCVSLSLLIVSQDTNELSSSICRLCEPENESKSNRLKKMILNILEVYLYWRMCCPIELLLDKIYIQLTIVKQSAIESRYHNDRRSRQHWSYTLNTHRSYIDKRTIVRKRQVMQERILMLEILVNVIEDATEQINRDS
jgi:hypothetical protein